MSDHITRQSLADGSVLARIREYHRLFPELFPIVLSDAELAASLDGILAAWDGRQDVWLFGYGSLIWNPAFRFVERRPALLTGWHRRFCLWMQLGRATPERPGLMLALDEGQACHGVAYRIAAAEVREELRLVWIREMIGGGYLARWVTVDTAGGPQPAITFTVNPDHPRYARTVDEAHAAECIAHAVGQLGTCSDYLFRTVDMLDELGLEDGELQRLAARVRAVKGLSATAPEAHPRGVPDRPKL